MLLQYVVWSQAFLLAAYKVSIFAIAYAKMNDQEMPGYMCHKDVSP